MHPDNNVFALLPKPLTRTYNPLPASIYYMATLISKVLPWAVSLPYSTKLIWLVLLHVNGT